MAPRIRPYEADELKKKKTIEEGPLGGLKVRTLKFRVWFAPQTQVITYQALYQNKWQICSPEGHFL